MNRIIYFISILLICCSGLAAQEAMVYGYINNTDTKVPVDFVTVFEKGSNNATETDQSGLYNLMIPAGKSATIIFSRIGYAEAEFKITPMPVGAKRNINVNLSPINADLEIVIRGSKAEDLGMIKEDVVQLKKLPSTTGNFESVLPHIALGTSSGTGGELSSQYNVRGGNYDENLIYVNDFEIFRPQLIRSGQQEGLTFPNIDLIRDLSFSSGGFQAKYGDKMSSVLDVKYKRPEETRGSVGLSLLGTSVHLEGSKKVGNDAYKKFRYLVGLRYKTNSYLLSSLDTKGEYTPNFTDIQSYLTYDISQDLQIGWIANYNRSQYNFVPRTRATASGLVDFNLQLSSTFEGQEEDEFSNAMSGLSLTYIPEKDDNPLYLKLLASAFVNKESERFDILGIYSLDQIETDLGSDEPGGVVATLGSGVQQNYARNFLYSKIYNAEHKGGIEFERDTDVGSTSNFIQWGAKWQREEIDDDLHEWERLDSAGYSLPYSETDVFVNFLLKSQNVFNSNRLSAYLQNTYSYNNDGELELIIKGGARISYWDLNKETLISPRLQLLIKPTGWDSDFSFKLAGGVYFQPPFYRELRRPDGSVNFDLKSQRSIHLLAGLTHDFMIPSLSDKKFKIITEVYYKKLDNLVSYEVDNVRLRYSGENDASGYVAGVDFRINGEFVPGAESWINLSILKARESLDDVVHLRRDVGQTEAREVNDVPRPTDQFMTLAMFFQDYLPRNENFKMNLNFTVGTGLPFGLKDNNQTFRNTYRYKAYHRVDIGFSYQLWNEDWSKDSPRSPFKFSKNTWVSLEVFNLMGVQNVASNTWIKSVGNRQYAIPNFLTSTRINLRFKFDL